MDRQSKDAVQTSGVFSVYLIFMLVAGDNDRTTILRYEFKTKDENSFLWHFDTNGEIVSLLELKSHSFTRTTNKTGKTAVYKWRFWWCRHQRRRCRSRRFYMPSGKWFSEFCFKIHAHTNMHGKSLAVSDADAKHTIKWKGTCARPARKEISVQFYSVEVVVFPSGDTSHIS